jgi:hypothetical protein
MKLVNTVAWWTINKTKHKFQLLQRLVVVCGILNMIRSESNGVYLREAVLVSL